MKKVMIVTGAGQISMAIARIGLVKIKKLFLGIGILRMLIKFLK